MKFLKVAVMSLAGVGLMASFAFAAGDVEKGKALFGDPTAFGAPGEKSCASCHPDGKGLEMAGAPDKKVWANPGGKWLALEDANNVCVMMANKGMTIDPASQEMMDLVAYIKSLHK